MSIQPVGTIPTIDVADRITIAMRHAGITAAKLAELIGSHPRTVGRWTRGQVKPPRAAIIAVAFCTGINAQWLETGKAPTDPDGGLSYTARDSNPEPAGSRFLAVVA